MSSRKQRAQRKRETDKPETVGEDAPKKATQNIHSLTPKKPKL